MSPIGLQGLRSLDHPLLFNEKDCPPVLLINQGGLMKSVSAVSVFICFAKRARKATFADISGSIAACLYR